MHTYMIRSAKFLALVLTALVTGPGCSSYVTQQDLAEQCETDECRNSVFANVTDEVYLERIVYESGNRSVQVAALQGISDSVALEKVALSEELPIQVRNEAIRRIHDRFALDRIASAAANMQIRDSAKGRLSQLKSIAIRESQDPAPSVRLKALEQIDDQVVLQKIALEDAEAKVRAAATARITDQSILAQLAVDESIHVGRRAVEKLTDQGGLSIAATEAPWESVRREATQRIVDQDVLQHIALTDRDNYVRLSAVSRIDDQAFLRRLLLESLENTLPGYEAESFATYHSVLLVGLFHKIEDREFVLDLARASDLRTKIYAANRLLEMDSDRLEKYAPDALVDHLIDLKIVTVQPELFSSFGYIRAKVDFTEAKTKYYQGSYPPVPAAEVNAVSYTLTLSSEKGDFHFTKSFTTKADSTESFRVDMLGKTKIILFDLSDICDKLVANVDRRAQEKLQRSWNGCLRVSAQQILDSATN